MDATVFGEDAFEIQHVENGPGIHFDPRGSLKIINGHIDIVVPVDISFISPHLINIQEVLALSWDLCNKSKIFKPTECTNTLQPLEVRFYDMIRDYDSISHLLPRRNKRSAWFSIIGTASKHLFGTLNEEDATLYDRAIRELQTDQKDLAQCVKEGLIVTTFALETFNKSLNQLAQNEKSLNNAINFLNNRINNISLTSNTLDYRIKMLELVNILGNSILTLSFKLEDISNGLMFSKNNILYPAIYSPKELYEDIVKILRFLPSSKEFPISIDLSNIHNVLRFSSLSSYYLSGKIVFALRIPLVYPVEFYIYHILPFPISVNNNSFAMIIPSAKYIGFSRDKTQYSNLENLEKCKLVDSQNYICNDLIILSTATHPICESELISKSLSSLPNQCVVKPISGNIELWQPLQENKWIYVISRNSKLTIDCPNKRISEANIYGTGIIKLPSGCNAYCRGIELISRQDIKYNSSHVNIDFNLLELYNINQTITYPNVIPELNIKSINFEPLLNNKEDLNVIKHRLENIITKPNVINHNHYISSFVFYCILTLIIILVYKLYKYCIPKIRGVLSPSINPNPPEDPESQPEIELTSPTPRLRF
ncbi:hypothetical protein K1T71_014744 [Dendrolimus kikuchii]|nr:hypothetical protein K1T71_014744 [Dendrolimus kikuchii]